MQAPQSAQVYVASNQFSLAVGKAGQNVRLAAKLTSSKIDIIDISKAEAAEEEESAEDAE
jgi:N utilization substance protein A